MIKDILKKAFILKREGHYKNALETLYKALELDNSSAELLLEIATLYNLLNDEERALNYINQALSINPTHIDSLKLLKKIFESKKAFAEAEQTAKNIYCISQNTNDLAELLRLMILRGNFQAVIDLDTESESPQILYEKAKAYYYSKDFFKAKEILESALQKAPNMQNLLLLYGLTLYRTNNKEKCFDIIKQLNEDEKNSELYNFLGLISTFENKYRLAIDYFNKAIKIFNTNDEYYYNLASVYLKNGELSNAKKYYNHAISLRPDNANYHFALANIYYMEKHYKRALEELDENLFEAKLLKAIILHDTGYLTLAKKELDQLSTEQPQNHIIQEYQNKINEELSTN